MSTALRPTGAACATRCSVLVKLLTFSDRRRVVHPRGFWLDARWFGGTTASGEERIPILRELAPILTAAQRGHNILIDGVREFVDVDGYQTLAELTGILEGHRLDLEMAVDADLIRNGPRSGG